MQGNNYDKLDPKKTIRKTKGKKVAQQFADSNRLTDLLKSLEEVRNNPESDNIFIIKDEQVKSLKSQIAEKLDAMVYAQRKDLFYAIDLNSQLNAMREKQDQMIESSQNAPQDLLENSKKEYDELLRNVQKESRLEESGKKFRAIEKAKLEILTDHSTRIDPDSIEGIKSQIEGSIKALEAQQKTAKNNSAQLIEEHFNKWEKALNQPAYQSNKDDFSSTKTNQGRDQGNNKNLNVKPPIAPKPRVQREGVPSSTESEMIEKKLQEQPSQGSQTTKTKSVQDRIKQFEQIGQDRTTRSHTDRLNEQRNNSKSEGQQL